MDDFYPDGLPSAIVTVQEACAFARVCEEAGDYARACDYLKPWWQIDADPRIRGLTSWETAEILLRAGTLIGCIGGSQHSTQQKKAQGWIHQSLILFELARHKTRVAECRMELGNCYYREGLLDLAHEQYQAALAGITPTEAREVYTVTLIRRAIVERQSARWWEARATLEQAGRLLGGKASAFLQGRYFNEYATTLKNLGQAEKDPDLIKESLLYFTQATQLFEAANNPRYCAAVLNNLGGLLVHLGQYAEAEMQFNLARRMFGELGDAVRAAQVDESRAQLLLTQQRYQEGAALISEAVRVLRASQEEVFLTEALLTQGTLQARCQRWREARYSCAEALRLAERCADFEAAGRIALILLEEMCERLADEERREMLTRAEYLLRATQQEGLRQRLAVCAQRVSAAAEAEKVRREQQIQQEKMAALGQLAFGVAHNFNNTLTALSGRVQLLQRLELPENVEQQIESLGQTVNEATGIIERIKEFGRQRPARDFQTVNIGLLVAEVAEMALPRCRAKGLVVAYEPVPPPMLVAGDSGELKEVLLNLVYNAVDASHAGGTITLGVQKSGALWDVSVRDTGQGMSAEVKAHLFEPFFTTKGKAGTGMGLAVSYSIIRRHNGNIKVDSWEGYGTTFHVTLPILATPLPPRPPRTETSKVRLTVPQVKLHQAVTVG